MLVALPGSARVVEWTRGAGARTTLENGVLEQMKAATVDENRVPWAEASTIEPERNSRPEGATTEDRVPRAVEGIDGRREQSLAGRADDARARAERRRPTGSRVPRGLGKM
jgi:hypothetical protein